MLRGCIVILVVVLASLAASGAIAGTGDSGRASAPVLYGIQSIDPLIADAAMRIPAPNGATIRVGEGTEYVLIDHLGSDRVLIDADATKPYEYGPFGDSATGISPSYTGKVFDRATGVYDFLARPYDPTLAGFLSVDPDRASTGPYAYVNGNPINFVDPDGRTLVHFLLYSRFGTEVPDNTGRPSLRDSIGELRAISKQLPILVVTAVMEDHTPVPVPLGRIQGSHMTIISHGDPGVFSAVDPYTDEVIEITGDEFPEFLRSSMARAYGDHAARIAAGTRSMSILSCKGACRWQSSEGQSEPSFAEDFAGVARPYFPNLESVVASSYDIYTGPDPYGIRQHEFDLGVSHVPHGDRETLSRYMGMEDFFRGRYPNDLFGPISQVNFGTLDKVWRLPWSTGRITQYRGMTDDRGAIGDYVRLHARELSEPVLRRIPVSPPSIPPAADFLPPTLPRE